jgi:hypothetical protein
VHDGEHRSSAGVGEEARAGGGVAWILFSARMASAAIQACKRPLVSRLIRRLGGRTGRHSSTLGVSVDVRSMTLVEPADELLQARIDGAAAHDEVRP